MYALGVPSRQKSRAASVIFSHVPTVNRVVGVEPRDNDVLGAICCNKLGYLFERILCAYKHGNVWRGQVEMLVPEIRVRDVHQNEHPPEGYGLPFHGCDDARLEQSSPHREPVRALGFLAISLLRPGLVAKAETNHDVEVDRDPRCEEVPQPESSVAGGDGLSLGPPTRRSTRQNLA